MFVVTVNFSFSEISDILPKPLSVIVWLTFFSLFLAAKNGDKGCYDKLNTEAAGYGTCDPTTNTSCAARYTDQI